MNRLVKKLDDPVFAKKTHATLGLMWFAASIPICIYLKSSISFLVFISVYAVVVGHWSGWDAAGAQVEVKKLEKK